MIDRCSPILALSCLIVAHADAGAHMVRKSTHVKGKWTLATQLPVWRGGTTTQRAAQREFATQAASLKKQFLAGSAESLQWAKRTKQELAFDLETTLTLDTPSLVSGYMTVFIDFAGAHPVTREIPIAVSPNGKLRLSDLATDPSKLLKTLVTDGLKKAKSERGTTLDGPIDSKLADSFVITPNGLTWVFEAYAVGAYAEGEYLVKVPWSSLKPYLKPNAPVPPKTASRR